MPTYVNNRNFYDGRDMQKRGQTNPSPTPAQIRAGHVREVKITQPVEVKDVPVRKQRKPKHKAESDSKLDE